VTIINTPDGDTDAAGEIQASLDDRLVIGDLLVDLGGIRWHVHTNIELGDSDLEASIVEELERSLEGWNGTVADDEMGLSSDTVDWDAVSLHAVDEGNEVGELGGSVVEVVVIEVELAVWIGLGGGAEGDFDGLLTEEAVEDGVTVGSVILEDLVGNVPVLDLALPASDEGGDVVLEDGGEGGSITDVADPLWELRVPEESVTTDVFAVLLGVVDEVITTGKVEGATGRLGAIPLHRVLWCEHTELLLDDVGDGSNAEGVLVNGGTKVVLALLYNLCVKAVGASGWDASWSGGGGRGWDGRGWSSGRGWDFDGGGGRGGGSSTWKTLVVPVIELLAGSARNAVGWSGVTVSTALSPHANLSVGNGRGHSHDGGDRERELHGDEFEE
jgi:hypothetical protein